MRQRWSDLKFEARWWLEAPLRRVRGLIMSITRIEALLLQLIDRLAEDDDEPPAEHPAAAAQGDRIVAMARAIDGRPPEEFEGPGTPNGLPFQHDPANAPLMVSVEGLTCEWPGCEFPRDEIARVITPFGEPILCRAHAAQVWIAGNTQSPVEERRVAGEALREVMRFGPGSYAKRLDWLAATREAEARGLDTEIRPLGAALEDPPADG